MTNYIDRKLKLTLQFINVAIILSPCEVMGGTQDKCTWSNNDNCKRDTFNQVIYGDGGNAVYDATMPTWRANEFTSGAGDSNFRNGDPSAWVVSTAPIRRSGEGPAFYWPQVGDPILYGRHAPDLQRCAPRLADTGVRRRHGQPGRPAAHDAGHRLHA